jgi:hypothetical protein
VGSTGTWEQGPSAPVPAPASSPVHVPDVELGLAAPKLLQLFLVDQAAETPKLLRQPLDHDRKEQIDECKLDFIRFVHFDPPMLQTSLTKHPYTFFLVSFKSRVIRRTYLTTSLSPRVCIAADLWSPLPVAAQPKCQRNPQSETCSELALKHKLEKKKL